MSGKSEAVKSRLALVANPNEMAAVFPEDPGCAMLGRVYVLAMKLELSVGKIFADPPVRLDSHLGRVES